VITKDSAYVFPITNYQSGLKETKIAGDNGQVSEVRQEGDLKFLYKLKVDETALKRRNINPRLTDYRKQTVMEEQISGGEALKFTVPSKADSVKKVNDFFQSEFDKEKSDSSVVNRQPVKQTEEEPVLRKAKLFDYKLKFSADNFTAGFNNDVLITKFQPYTGTLPVTLSGSDAFNGFLKASVFDLFEDIRFTGAIRLPLFSGGGGTVTPTTGGSIFYPGNSSFFDGSGEWYARADYLKKRFDFSLVYYRETQVGTYLESINSQPFDSKSFTNLWQGIVKYPFDKVRSLRFSFGLRTDKITLRPSGISYDNDTLALKSPDVNKQTYGLLRLEYVYDNTILKATNIWNGLRYKIYFDFNQQINTPQNAAEGRNTYNLGFDARHYYPIFRNLIWAVRAAGDFSWGNKKIVYYLGGSDGWLFPKANQLPYPQDPTYAFQSLAVNLRGFRQNVANGNNAVVINSEFRLPVFTTLFNKPINNAFLRNFEILQFFDLGTAWNGKYNGITRPTITYTSDDLTNPVSVLIKAGGIGPFAGGYGFGVRSMLLGYFLRLDAGWEMNSFFRGKPLLHFSMGVDF